jgi:hypothetical protein
VVFSQLIGDSPIELAIKEELRSRWVNMYKRVNYFEKILYFKFFKHLYFQFIYENLELDVIFFFLSINKVLSKPSLLNWGRLKKYLDVRQHSISYLKKSNFNGMEVLSMVYKK